jgi:pimeloyl-ACP methyl ester carboxylesterase
MTHTALRLRDDSHRSGKFRAIAKRRLVLDVADSFRALASGGALHVDGPPGAPAVLFLHGVGGGAWSWRPQRDALAATHRTFVWEARGHGAAAAVDDAGLADYFNDAEEGLAAATGEVNAPVVIAAHSMGGLLAFALARKYAASVRALFLVDPVYATGDEAYGHFSPRTGAIARFLCAPLLRSFERDGMLSRLVARWVFARAFEDRARMETAWQQQRRQVPFEYPRMLNESFGRPEGFELSDFAREIVAPTALIEGSPVPGRVRFPALANTLRERLGPNFRHEIVAGGHYLQLDRPAEINALLAQFLARYG